MIDPPVAAHLEEIRTRLAACPPETNPHAIGPDDLWGLLSEIGGPATEAYAVLWQHARDDLEWLLGLVTAAEQALADRDARLRDVRETHPLELEGFPPEIAGEPWCASCDSSWPCPTIEAAGAAPTELDARDGRDDAASSAVARVGVDLGADGSATFVDRDDARPAMGSELDALLYEAFCAGEEYTMDQGVRHGTGGAPDFPDWIGKRRDRVGALEHELRTSNG